MLQHYDEQLKNRYNLDATLPLFVAQKEYDIKIDFNGLSIWNNTDNHKEVFVKKDKYDFLLSGNKLIPLLFGSVIQDIKYNLSMIFRGISINGYFEYKINFDKSKFAKNVSLTDIIFDDSLPKVYIKLLCDMEENQEKWLTVVFNNEKTLLDLQPVSISTIMPEIMANFSTGNKKSNKILQSDTNQKWEYTASYLIGITRDTLFIFDKKMNESHIKVAGVITDYEVLKDKLYVVIVKNAQSILQVYNLDQSAQLTSKFITKSLGRIDLSFPSNKGLCFKVSDLLNGCAYYEYDEKKAKAKLHRVVPYTNKKISIDNSFFDEDHFYIKKLFIKEVKNKGSIFSFHGGPESFEQLDDRWLADYEKYLNAGYTVYIVNYPGSISFGKKYAESIWKNWENEISLGIQRIATDCVKNYNLLSYKLIFLGGSFGAPLAYRFCEYFTKTLHFTKTRAILISPLVNLRQHINKLDEDNRKWFTQRFSEKDINYLSIASDKDIPSFELFCLQGINDEILSTFETLDYFSKLSRKNYKLGKLEIIPEMIHGPLVYSQYEELIRFIRQGIEKKWERLELP